MRFSIAMAVAVFSIAYAGIATGQDDPIAARKAAMKANGAAMKVASDMLKGTTPYDAAAAAEAMQKIEDDMKTFADLFPEGSDQGDTDAAAAIWQNMDDFRARAVKLGSDAAAAREAAAQGPEAFQAAFAAVGANCGGCHRPYRN